jgi:Ser/Thr protein kinase RdoA (MazF antagonist)
VIEKSDAVFARLFRDTDELMLIHGDLHYWNVHVHQGEIYLIDFEDVNLGYPVQDIAITLSYGQHREGYQEWKSAFMEGYTSIREWPNLAEDVIPTLTAARTAMFINYAARIEEDPREYIQSRLEGLRKYLGR